VVVLEPGSFTMGSPPDERGRPYLNEGPPRTVSIAYRLAVGRTEVTRREFWAFVSSTGYRTEAERNVGAVGEVGCLMFQPRGAQWYARTSWLTHTFTQVEDHPAACVSWNDVQEYVKWLNKVSEVKGWRLLSEAEWEYAARAGTTTTFPWGDDWRRGQRCRFANWGDATARRALEGADELWPYVQDCHDGYSHAAPAGKFQPNRWGLHDMPGNVREWVQDCYDHDAYSGKAPSDGRAHEVSGCESRVVRGGSWIQFSLNSLSPASRDGHPVYWRFGHVGFRLARTVLQGP
jgi:formylglycine-generating enzyme required for sulfatase activity